MGTQELNQNTPVENTPVKEEVPYIVSRQEEVIKNLPSRVAPMDPVTILPKATEEEIEGAKQEFPTVTNGNDIANRGYLLDTDYDAWTRQNHKDWARNYLVATETSTRSVKEITITCMPSEFSFVGIKEPSALKKKPVEKVVGMDWILSKREFEGEIPPEKGLIVADSMKDELNLSSITFTVEIDDNDTLFARYRKYVEVTNKNGEKVVVRKKWSTWSKIDGSQNGVQLSDTIIRTPIGTVEVDFSHSEEGEVVITGSEFSMFNGPGRHESTTWKVRDLDQSKLFERIRDKDNLTELRLPMQMFSGNKGYEINFRYHSHLNGESNWARVIYLNYDGNKDLFHATLDFGIIMGKDIYVSIHAYTELFESSDIEIRDENEKVVKAKYEIPSKAIRIDSVGLKENTIYKIYVKCRLSMGVETGWKLVKEVICVANNYYHFNKNMIYINKHTFSQEIIMGGNTNITTKQGYRGDILLMQHGSNTLNLYVMSGGKLLDQGVVYKFEDHFTLPYLNVIRLPNDDVLLNYCLQTEEDYRKSVFVYLRYDHFKKSFTQVSRVVRDDERWSTAVSHSVAVDYRGQKPHVYYIPARYVVAGKEENLRLYKIDYSDPENLVFTEHAPLPFEAKRNVSLSFTHDCRLIVMGGTDDKKYIEKGTGKNPDIEYWRRKHNDVFVMDVDGDSKEWSLLCKLPEQFHPKLFNIHAILRRDNKLVCFNASSASGKDQHRFMVIDYIKGVAETFNTEINDNIPFKNTIVLNNGDILRISSADHDPQKVFRYAAVSTHANDRYDDEHAKRHEQVLFVRSRETITIEDPSIYDSIIIAGSNEDNTGTLRVLSQSQLHKFNYRHRIFTRDTALTGREYRRIERLYEIVEWGCNITVDNTETTDNEFQEVGLRPNVEELKASILDIVNGIKKEGVAYVTENNYTIKITPIPLTDQDVQNATTHLNLEITEIITGKSLTKVGVLTDQGVLKDAETDQIIFPNTEANIGVSYYEVYQDDTPITVIQNTILLLIRKPETKDTIASIVTTDKVTHEELRAILADLLLNPGKLYNDAIVQNLATVVRTLGGEYEEVDDSKLPSRKPFQ